MVSNIVSTTTTCVYYSLILKNTQYSINNHYVLCLWLRRKEKCRRQSYDDDSNSGRALKQRNYVVVGGFMLSIDIDRDMVIDLHKSHDCAIGLLLDFDWLILLHLSKFIVWISLNVKMRARDGCLYTDV